MSTKIDSGAQVEVGVALFILEDKGITGCTVSKGNISLVLIGKSRTHRSLLDEQTVLQDPIEEPVRVSTDNGVKSSLPESVDKVAVHPAGSGPWELA